MWVTASSTTLHFSPPSPKVFTDGFSEGQARDIEGGFPYNSDSYTEYYDYWSDSDLEDESETEGEEPAEEDGCKPLPNPEDAPDPTTVPEYPSPRPSLVDANKVQNFDRSASRFTNGFLIVGQLRSQI
jgi:hypothetical protein